MQATEEHNAISAQCQALEYQEHAGVALSTPADVDCPVLRGLVTQVLPGVLAAAADADATAFIITSGPSARTGTKSSGGGGLFAFGGRGAQGADRAVQLADKAGVGSYFVLRGAGLTPTSPPSAAPGLIVAEGGSVDPALAGQVRLACMQGTNCCSLHAPKERTQDLQWLFHTHSVTITFVRAFCVRCAERCRSASKT